MEEKMNYRLYDAKGVIISLFPHISKSAYKEILSISKDNSVFETRFSFKLDLKKEFPNSIFFYFGREYLDFSDRIEIQSDCIFTKLKTPNNHTILLRNEDETVICKTMFFSSSYDTREYEYIGDNPLESEEAIKNFKEKSLNIYNSKKI